MNGQAATAPRAVCTARVANLASDGRADTARVLSLPIATATTVLGMSPAVRMTILDRQSESRLITPTVSRADTSLASVEIALRPAHGYGQPAAPQERPRQTLIPSAASAHPHRRYRMSL